MNELKRQKQKRVQRNEYKIQQASEFQELSVALCELENAHTEFLIVVKDAFEFPRHILNPFVRYQGAAINRNSDAISLLRRAFDQYAVVSNPRAGRYKKETEVQDQMKDINAFCITIRRIALASEAISNVAIRISHVPDHVIFSLAMTTISLVESIKSTIAPLMGMLYKAKFLRDGLIEDKKGDVYCNEFSDDMRGAYLIELTTIKMIEKTRNELKQ